MAMPIGEAVSVVDIVKSGMGDKEEEPGKKRNERPLRKRPGSWEVWWSLFGLGE